MGQKTYKYESLIYEAQGKGGAYVIFPYDIREEFGKGRVKVHATFDGEPYDGSIVNMGVTHADGSICYIIGIRKGYPGQNRQAAGRKSSRDHRKQGTGNVIPIFCIKYQIRQILPKKGVWHGKKM